MALPVIGSSPHASTLACLVGELSVTRDNRSSGQVQDLKDSGKSPVRRSASDTLGSLLMICRPGRACFNGSSRFLRVIRTRA